MIPTADYINYEKKFKVINLIIENILTEKCSHMAMLFINIYIFNR